MKKKFTAKPSCVNSSSNMLQLGEYGKYYDWDYKVGDSVGLDRDLSQEEYEDYAKATQEVGDNYGYKFVGWLKAKPEYQDIIGYGWEYLDVFDDNGILRVCESANGRIYDVSIHDIEDIVTG